MDVFDLENTGEFTCCWNEIVHHFYPIKVDHNSSAEKEDNNRMYNLTDAFRQNMYVLKGSYLKLPVV